MNNIAVSLRKIHAQLKDRPLMIYGGDLNYYSIAVFLDGYSRGLLDGTGFDLLVEGTNWLKVKKNIKLNTYWTHYIGMYYHDLPDDEKITALLNLFEEYLNDLWG